MRTKLTLGQSDGFDKCLELIELEGGQSKSFADDVYHLVVAGRVGFGIFGQVFVGIALKFFDDATGDEFHVAL